jgi:hypothetical protein
VAGSRLRIHKPFLFLRCNTWHAIYQFIPNPSTE